MHSRFVTNSFLAAAAGAAMLVTGCGGTSGSHVGEGASILISGGATLAVGQANQSLSAQASFRQIPVQIEGLVRTGVHVPLGVALIIAQAVAVIERGSVFFGARFPDGPSPVLVNGQSSGLVLNQFTGEQEGDMALPPGNYAFQTNRALLVGGNNAEQSIGQLEFVYRVELDGTSTMPVAFSGRLPADGETMVGAFLNLEFDTRNRNLDNTFASITIEHSGGTIFQQQLVVDGQVSFSGFDDVGPISGVRNIRLEVQ